MSAAESRIVRGDAKIYKKIPSVHPLEDIRYYDTFPEFLGRIEAFGDAPAMAFGEDAPLSYADLVSAVRGMCAYFAAQGLPREGNIGIYSPNSAFFAVCSFAVMAYGACAVHIPPSLPAAVLPALVQKYGLVTVLCPSVPEGADIPVLCPGDPLLYRERAADGRFADNLRGTDPACIFFTGGTTGKSKGAILSHTALLAGPVNAMYTLSTTEHVDAYHVLPLTHVFGYIRGFLVNLYLGNTVYFNAEKKNMFRDLRRVRPHEMVAVPRLCDMMLEFLEAGGAAALGGRMHTVISGAAPVPQYLVRRFAEYGITVYPGYGMTETVNLTSGNPIPLEKPGSVGPVYPFTEAKIVDGELWLRGLNLFSGYYADEAETKAAFTDGWFRTGDLAHFDADNYLYITGRVKSLIVLPNGEKISPDVLELAVLGVDEVQDALLYLADRDGKKFLRLEVTLRKNAGAGQGATAATPDTAQAATAPSAEETAAQEAAILRKIAAAAATVPEILRPQETVIRREDFARTPAMKIKRP